MTDPKPEPVLAPVTARETFTLLAKLAQRVQPEDRGKAIADAAEKLAKDLSTMPLSPRELADAFAALGTPCGIQPKSIVQRRRDCVDMAGLLVASLRGGQSGPKVFAGEAAPSANAIRAWAVLADHDSDAWREFIELTAHTALRIIKRGAAKVRSQGAWSGFLASIEPDSKGSITIDAVGVGDAEFVLPSPIVVSKQAALHRVAHPWALLGLHLGDVGHAHPQPPKAASAP